MEENTYDSIMERQEILNLLPYDRPFLFVDELLDISETGARGTFQYPEESEFYRGHFKNMPVTPGVILTETMAQIGVVCLGIYLIRDLISDTLPQIALTSSAVDFYVPVFPNERVTVVSEREIWRFGKLRCKVKMFNDKNELVCRGTIAGMVKI